MNGDDVKRASAVAGTGGFVLVLMLLLAFVEPTRALFGGLLAGLAVGAGVLVAGYLALLSRPVVPPAPRIIAVAGEPAEPELPGAAQAQGGALLAAALSAGLAGKAAGDRAPVPAVPAGPAPAPAEEPGSAATSPHDTSTLTVDDVVKAQDLHQTVRLDQLGTQYALPELSPEQVLRDREGIDEAFLKAGIGLEETPPPSENSLEDQKGTGG